MDMQVDERWEAVRQRRAAADGAFVYSVRSTGVYCRPSCASRAARAENVAFHADCDAAEAAGFRACKRCDPRGERDLGAMIVACCARIDAAETVPPLAVLAGEAGYSAAHFQRLFKARTGVSPRQYAAFRRAERMRLALAGGGPVTAAVYDAGYNAGSRFYAEADAVLGMKPGVARRGGAGERIRFAVGATRLGLVLAAATQAGLCHVALGEDPAVLEAELRRRFSRADVAEEAGLAGLLERVIGLVERRDDAALPLDIRGTAFQRRVWEGLRRLGVGETVSYAALAERIGAPGSARAVAAACAANTIAVAVPCHRVVRGDGGLAGYRWGVARKRALLEAEAVRLKQSVPTASS